MKNNSLHIEPVCAVGQGVSALCCATEGQKWIFNGYSLTGVSIIQQKHNVRFVRCLLRHFLLCLKPPVFELVRRPDFANLPLIVEDFVKDSGGSYTGEFML